METLFIYDPKFNVEEKREKVDKNMSQSSTKYNK